MKGITARQEEILQLVSDFLQEGRLPSAVRLAEQLGLAGESSVTPILKALERKGYLNIKGGIKGRPRELSLTPKGKLVVQRPGLPVVGSIAAGAVKEALETADEYVERLDDLLPFRPGDFLLEVDGESMVGDGILPGDRVLIRPGLQPSSGEIAAVAIAPDHEATLKRVILGPKRGTVTLRAANPAFEDMQFPADRVHIIGVLRGLVRTGG